MPTLQLFVAGGDAHVLLLPSSLFIYENKSRFPYTLIEVFVSEKVFAVTKHLRIQAVFFPPQGLASIYVCGQLSLSNLREGLGSRWDEHHCVVSSPQLGSSANKEFYVLAPLTRVAVNSSMGLGHCTPVSG